jgi:hypothetical protein
MKINKNIITVSCLLTLLNSSAQVFASGESEDNSLNPTINHDISRLPAEFCEKFRLGKYIIDESDGNIRIDHYDINDEKLQKLAQAIKNESVRDFWTIYASNNSDKTIIYLQVGSEMCRYPELFERLIIVHGEKVLTDLCRDYKNPVDNFSGSEKAIVCIKNDCNIVQKLRESEDLSEAFQKGNVEIYVYHEVYSIITLLRFDRRN